MGQGLPPLMGLLHYLSLHSPPRGLTFVTLTCTGRSWGSKSLPHCTLQSHRGPGAPQAHILPTGLWYMSCGWMKPCFQQMGGCGRHTPSSLGCQWDLWLPSPPAL